MCRKIQQTKSIMLKKKTGSSDKMMKERRRLWRDQSVRRKLLRHQLDKWTKKRNMLEFHRRVQDNNLPLEVFTAFPKPVVYMPAWVPKYLYHEVRESVAKFARESLFAPKPEQPAVLQS